MEKSTKSIFNLSAVKTAIEAANKELIALLVIGDSVGVSNCFTKDAKFMKGGTAPIVGIESIEATFSEMIASGVSNLALKTLEVWGDENLITEEGEYSLFAGETKLDHGKFMVLWKKENGKWKLHRDMISSNVA